MEKVEVLDIQAGMQIVSDDVLIYKALLRKLLAKNVNILTGLDDLILDNQYERILKILFSIKASFAILGAYEVYHDIQNMEESTLESTQTLSESYNKIKSSVQGLKNNW